MPPVTVQKGLYVHRIPSSAAVQQKRRAIYRIRAAEASAQSTFSEMIARLSDVYSGPGLMGAFPAGVYPRLLGTFIPAEPRRSVLAA
jgi:hypothetical protein